mgnify:CR=1 FL=1
MDKYTGTDNLEVMKEAKNYNQYLIELIKQHTNKKSLILDFGAGIGTFAQNIKVENYNVMCIEPDINQLEVIKRLNIKAYQNLDDVDDNSLDFIYSFNVLEHIEDDLLTVKKLKNKLKDGGRMLIYVPAFQVLFSSMDKKVGHFRRYNFKMVENLAQKTNFNIEKLQYVDSLGFFITLLYKFIGNKDGDIDKRSIMFYDKIIFPISQKLDMILNKYIGKNIYVILKK